MISSSKITVGVLRGGPSREYEVSLQTGANVLKELPDRYRPIDFFIDRKGVWHVHGVALPPHKALKKVDVVFNALHGEYGEDGQVQELLGRFGMPFTGSKKFASAVAMNKALTKKFLAKHGIKTPYYKVFKTKNLDADMAREIFRTMPQPAVVKPLALGSSVGVSIVRTFPELFEALTRVRKDAEQILIEEYIAGREATCGVLDLFRGEPHYALLPIEIIPPKESAFFDYDAKYSGGSREICPGRFSPEIKKEIQRLATTAHKLLDLRHYSRSDFIVSPRRGIYFLEVNTLPGLTAESLFPKALAAIGSSTPQFLDHVLSLALAGN